MKKIKKYRIIFFIIITICLIILILRNISVFQPTSIVDEDKYITELAEKEYKEKLRNREDFFVYIYSSECKYCEKFYPIYMTELQDKEMKSYRMNTDYYQTFLEKELSDKFQGTPAVYFYVNGKLIDYFVGMQTKDKINEYLLMFGKEKEKSD